MGRTPTSCSDWASTSSMALLTTSPRLFMVWPLWLVRPADGISAGRFTRYSYCASLGRNRALFERKSLASTGMTWPPRTGRFFRISCSTSLKRL